MKTFWRLACLVGFAACSPAPAIAVDVQEEPDYYDRRISTLKVDEDIAEWTLRNCLSWHYLPQSFKFRPNLPKRFLRSWINDASLFPLHPL